MAGAGIIWKASSFSCLAPGPGRCMQPGVEAGKLAELGLLRCLCSLFMGFLPQGGPGQPDVLLCGSGLWCTCPKREGWRWEGSVCLLLWLRLGNHTASFWHVLSLRSKSLELPTSEPTLMRRALRNWRHVLSHHGELRWRVQHVDFGRWQSVVAVRSVHFRSPQ